MYEIILKYQTCMGWNDTETVIVLSDFIEKLLAPSHEAHERAEKLINYMERRTKEEKELEYDLENGLLD